MNVKVELDRPGLNRYGIFVGFFPQVQIYRGLGCRDPGMDVEGLEAGMAGVKVGGGFVQVADAEKHK
jgi:hypothetical protein